MAEYIKGNMEMGYEPVKTLYTVFVANKSCNLKCKYCSTEHSDFLNELNQTPYQEKNAVLRKSRLLIDSKILKVVGGGEIFLDNHLEDWLEPESENYSVVFVLTNGVNVKSDRIRRLAQIKNIHLGLSLDGHTFEMNEYRHAGKEVFNKVINTLEHIGENKIPLQINMVMHDKNHKDTFEYLRFLKSKKYPLTVHMFPVMTKEQSNKSSLTARGWENVLEEVIGCHDEFADILLPKGYFNYLLEYLKNDENRLLRCYIPYYMVQLFSTGRLTSCPIIWNKDLGTVDQPYRHLYSDNIYQLLNHPKIRVPFCRNCFSSYDIFNLYMNEAVSHEELTGIPLFSGEEVSKRLKEIKNSLNKGG